MDIKLAYGIKEGRVIHISELKQTENGEKCNCTCLECGAILVAKLGNKNQWHFAHKNAKCDIDKAQQTGIHSLAEEIIRESRSIMVPELVISRQEVMPEGADAYVASDVDIQMPNISSCMFDYDSVHIEEPIKDIVADAVIGDSKTKCIIEVAVTHFVDELKENKLKKIGLSAFEIDLSDLLKRAPNKEEIAEAVLRDETNRKWVFNRKREQLFLAKKDEFQKKYDIAYLKREQEKKQEQEIRQKKVQELRRQLISGNYVRELRRLRNDEQAAQWFKYFSFSKRLSTYPFFMDIPITGEFVFACDRRIWQGKLFNDYVYCGGIGFDYEFIFTDQIQERIFRKKMIVRDAEMIVQFDPEKAYSIKGQEPEFSFSYDVIQRYLEYLELLGFIYKHSEDLWWWARSETVDPPNHRSADILNNILKSVDCLSPDINQIIKNELLSSKLSKREKDDILKWRNPN